MVECFSVDFDHRLQCYVVLCRADYRWYLDATSGAESNLKIQRDIIKGQKTYQTLREDLKRGCVLPPVVLSMQGLSVPQEFQANPSNEYLLIDPLSLGSLRDSIENHSSDHVQIIDGLQRTNAIRSVVSELDDQARERFLARPIRFEVWLNIPLDALAYRMLLLNAGQKPMSMKHQIEVLADNMRSNLQGVPNLDIIRGMDKRRRTQPGQFQLAILTGAFQAWLQKSPNVDLRNAVTEQLLAEDAVDELGRGLSPSAHSTGDKFKEFIGWLVELDRALGPENQQFLANETVVHALAASISKFTMSDDMAVRCAEAQARLLQQVGTLGPEKGFGVELFMQFRDEIDPKKQNVGDAIRLLVFRAMSEYIVSSGSSTMREAWTFASQYLK